MELALHANATTTPKIRSYIQRSKKPAVTVPKREIVAPR
jgi:hypothetical protein